eukprot:11000559-Alexandrium_andersonii.AAC.1
MAARAKAFSKGFPPEPPSELDFSGRPLGDPRRRLVGEGTELCSRRGQTVAYGSGRQCHWCHLRHHVDCLGPCQVGERGYVFCEHCEPLREHPRKQ